MGVRHQCRAKGCEREARARNLCVAHYAQLLRHGRLHESNRHVLCTVVGCGKRHFAKALCQVHYRQVTRTGKIKEVQKDLKPTCFIAACSRKKWSRGLCNTHYNFFLIKYIHEGKTWIDIDRIIADLNQNSLASTQRLRMIVERHKKLLKEKDAYFKREVFKDMLAETLLESEEIAEDLGDLDVLIDSGESDDFIGRKEEYDELDTIH